jgi:hypothetical protein
MLCVFLADFSRDFGILCTSLLIPWSSLCLPLFFEVFMLLEYWNICWLWYFLKILCMKNLLCLCAGLILIYLWLMNCCIDYMFLWHSFDSLHKYHIVFRTNRIWFFLVIVFLEIILLNLGSGIWYPAAPSTVFHRWIFWKTDCCWSHLFIFPKVSGVSWALPPTHAKSSVASPSDLHQLEVQWWIFSFILQTSCLVDVNLRIARLRLCKIKQLKVFQSMVPDFKS